MSRDPLRLNDYLAHILEAISRIHEYLEDVDEVGFLSNHLVQDAVIRNFEIIGEACKRVPVEIRDRFADIPWKEAAGFRDVLIHDYPEIIIDEVYFTAKNQLPEFRNQIQHVLESLGQDK